MVWLFGTAAWRGPLVVGDGSPAPAIPAAYCRTKEVEREEHWRNSSKLTLFSALQMDWYKQLTLLSDCQKTKGIYGIVSESRPEECEITDD